MNSLCIAVLFGGRGAEHDVSVRSAEDVLSHMPPAYTVLPVLIRKDGTFTHADTGEEVFPVKFGDTAGFLFRKDGRIQPVDVVFPVLHGDFGEDGRVQGLLSCAGLPFVGADVLCGALCMDKILTKRLARGRGVPVVPFVALSRGTPDKAVYRMVTETFGIHPYPLFVKPSALGSSVGAAVVGNGAELLRAVREAEVYGEVLVEEYLARIRELEVGWLDGAVPMFSDVGEITSAEGFYDYSEKYEKQSADIRLPAELSDETADAVYRYAADMVRTVGARDLCRVDFFLAEDGRLYFNEINTFPGFTDISLYPRMFARMGLSQTALITRLAESAYARRI